MLAIVEDGFDARAVGGEDRLGACGQVDPVIRVSCIFDVKKKWQ